LGTQPAGVGISIGIHSALRNQKPETAYFVKLRDRNDVFAFPAVQASYVKGYNVYLLNVEPGFYAVVAASYSQFLPGGRIDRIAYFPENLIRKTIAEVKPGAISYMGTYEVDMAFMAGFRGADRAQQHYHRQISKGDISTFLSTEKKSVRDAASEKEFFQGAKDDFPGSEWLAVVNGTWERIPALDRIERVVAQVERAEKGESGQSRDRPLQELAQADGELVEYVKSNPDDVRGLILSARLGRIQSTLKPLSLVPGKPSPDVAASFAPLLAKLDRALALSPSSAEAHYWKGRLLGVRNPVIREGILHYAPINLQGAIASLREAVKLAPADVSFREVLALYLIENEQPDDALTVMQPTARGGHPLYNLLSDLKRFPLPDGAVFSPQDSLGIAQMRESSGAPVSYPSLRLRVYLLPMPATDVERFFASHWPGFRLLPQEERKLPSGGEMRSFAQYLAEKESVYRPATSSSELPASPKEGVMLSVIDFRNIPPEHRRRDIPSSFGATYSILTVLNFR